MHKLLFLLISLFMLTACSKEDDPLPDYVQDLADLQTNGNGQAFRITFDNGRSFSLSNPAGGLKADTTYRVLALYTQGTESVRLTDFAQILAPEARRYDKQTVRHDAINLMAMWKTPRYINLRFQIKGTHSGTHYFGFKRFDIIENADGSKTLPVRLIHNQNNDPEYYARESYISLPLTNMSGELETGRDSIRMIVNTYKGETQRTYVF